ncbi:hypothetical protein SK128_019529 [Halocaridina rubra]|uniref:Uncharacterized protein n=1 Tax=Halocaridina rubra TaxID=373956 RepID=A0AAN8ZWX0_HALRR
MEELDLEVSHMLLARCSAAVTYAIISSESPTKDEEMQKLIVKGKSQCSQVKPVSFFHHCMVACPPDVAARDEIPSAFKSTFSAGSNLEPCANQAGDVISVASGQDTDPLGKKRQVLILQ